jgi:hypothetical protein
MRGDCPGRPRLRHRPIPGNDPRPDAGRAGSAADLGVERKAANPGRIAVTLKRPGRRRGIATGKG